MLVNIMIYLNNVFKILVCFYLFIIILISILKKNIKFNFFQLLECVPSRISKYHDPILQKLSGNISNFNTYSIIIIVPKTVYF